MHNRKLISFQTILMSLFACIGTFTISADVISSNVPLEIQEPSDTYDNGEPTLLTIFARTVIANGPCEIDNYDGCTLNGVLNDINSTDDFKPEIKVHFSADDYPDDGLESNAELRQRGATSRFAPQKSFRMKLDKEVPLWRGEGRLQLLKSHNDFARVRNKLSYDLFKSIPHLPSMRTQFVNLFIEDQGNSEDQGLYTQVEYVGKEYLQRRGWDKDSPVYKAENFYFRDDVALALDAQGEPIDIDAFEKIVEIKRGDDHSKFVEMVKSVDNSSLNFNDVFDQYYNRDNYLSWFAVNLLLGNYDTSFHNFYLFNPKGSEKFYFLPWDYDLSLDALLDPGEETLDDLPRWEVSHAKWWGQKLHQRFLKEPGNLDLLKEALIEVKNKYLTSSQIQARTDSYRDIVFPLVTSSPDFNHIYLSGGNDPEVIASYNTIYADLSNRVEENYNRFLEHIGDPMPFDLFDPEFIGNDDIRFSWDSATSLTGDGITYDMEISETPEFQSSNIVDRVTEITDTNHVLHWTRTAGTYFYRVIARNAAAPQQFWQVGYNDLPDGIYGVVKFTSPEGDTTNPPPVQPPTEPPVVEPPVVEPPVVVVVVVIPPTTPPVVTPPAQPPQTDLPLISSKKGGSIPWEFLLIAIVLLVGKRRLLTQFR